MNQHDSSFEVFHGQRELFCQLLKVAVAKDYSGLSSPSLQRALDFAEAVIVCPSVEAATLRIERDLEGARSFLVVADKVVSLSSKSDETVLQQRLTNAAPFYVLACVVLEQCKFEQGGTHDVEV